MPKGYLIICDSLPYGSKKAGESLDLAMAAAAFDLPVQLLLRGDAVYGALQSQAPDELGHKNFGKQLGALSIYGVEGVYLDKAALSQRGLSEGSLVPSVKVLVPEAVRTAIKQAELVVQL